MVITAVPKPVFSFPTPKIPGVLLGFLCAAKNGIIDRSDGLEPWCAVFKKENDDTITGGHAFFRIAFCILGITFHPFAVIITHTVRKVNGIMRGFGWRIPNIPERGHNSSCRQVRGGLSLPGDCTRRRHLLGLLPLAGARSLWRPRSCCSQAVQAFLSKNKC